MNRRNFLRNSALGLGTLSLPSLSRANVETPKRLLIFYTQHGVWYDNWKMRTGQQSDDHSWHTALSSLQENYSVALQPLSGLASKSIVIDALALASAEVDESGLRHELGGVHSLTGANITMIGSKPLASAPSIDQIIASELSTPRQFRSLEWGVGESSQSVIYRGARDVLPICNSPVSAAQRIFGRGQESSLVQQQQRVLSAVQEEYNSFSTQLDAEDKRKVEQHADLISDLGARLEGLESRLAECRFDAEIPATDGYGDTFNAFLPLISTAFSCDLTRVISLQMGQIPSQELFPGETFDIHADAAHKVWVNAHSADVMTQYTRYHAAQLATLATMLDSVIDPQGDGVASLLDNTMIVWAGELGDGAHGFERWPAVIVGGNGFSSFQYDRYLYHPSTTPIEGWSFNGILPSMGLPHQRLLNSIAYDFGLTSTVVGERSLLDGNVDCSSLLDGLF